MMLAQMSMSAADPVMSSPFLNASVAARAPFTTRLGSSLATASPTSLLYFEAFASDAAVW